MSYTNILILSTDKPRTKLVKTHLSKANFLVQVVESGADAMRVIHELKPMLILINWQPPGSGSLALIQSLRTEECTKKLPIILMGTETNSEEKLRGLEAGANLCLEDPFQTREFIARVNALLRRVYPPDSPSRSLDSS